MPLYEYICEQDGTVIEVLRPMADADKPLDDPEGRGRVFKRRHSTFIAAGSGSAGSRGGGGDIPLGSCCPCGKLSGSCGNS